jgi:hypothetical protein
LLGKLRRCFAAEPGDFRNQERLHTSETEMCEPRAIIEQSMYSLDIQNQYWQTPGLTSEDLPALSG